MGQFIFNIQRNYGLKKIGMVSFELTLMDRVVVNVLVEVEISECSGMST
jgi:hypothetical protein